MVTLIDSVGAEASSLVSIDASVPGVWGSVSILTHVGVDPDKASIAMDVREGLRLRGLDTFEAFGASAVGRSPCSSGSTWQVPPKASKMVLLVLWWRVCGGGCSAATTESTLDSVSNTNCELRGRVSSSGNASAALLLA